MRPVVEHREPVAQGQRLVLVVGDDDERDADLALDRLQLDLHLLAQLEVEGAERFVEQQHPRPSDECAGQRDALTLAARQLRGLAAAPRRTSRTMSSASEVRLRRSVARHSADLQAVFDVLGHGHVGEQGVFLEHGVDVAAPRGQCGDVDAAEPDHPGRRLLEAGDHAQHGGLARAGRAEDREQLAVGDGEVCALDGHDLVPGVAEFLAHTGQLDLRIVNGGGGVNALLRTGHPRGHCQILRIPRSNRSLISDFGALPTLSARFRAEIAIQVTVAKNVRMSSTSTSGASIAAK